MAYIEAMRSVGLRLLALIAVLLIPLGMPAAPSAAAAMPGDGQMMMIDHSGPCHIPIGSSAAHHNTDGKSCCVSMCMAVAVAPAVPNGAVPTAQQVAHFARIKSYQGLPSEIATPPPRFA